MLGLALYDKERNCIASKQDEKHIHLLADREYQDGDHLVLEVRKPQYLRMKLDTGVEEAWVYAKAGTFVYPIPFGESRMPYASGTFAGRYHIYDILSCEPMTPGWRDISTNPLDVRGETILFPHCSASIETRDESIFAARNTIDGFIETNGHGEWPYTSWGDNEDPNAQIRIDFGRFIILHQLIINLRSDFPHDNYWKQADIVFHDGERRTIRLMQSGEDQSFDLDEKRSDSILLCNLRKDENNPSPFPALTHWRVLGKDNE